MTFSSSNVVDLIGKEWYFARVHDAVQVCLRHFQSLRETPKTADPSSGTGVWQRAEDSSVSELESGTQIDPQLEPLLSRKSSLILMACNI
ncbi:sulfate transporter 4.2 [Pyrus ussuriensis x Pyrus communis]|uniref:Sulfate transporter 4.2 n=1 Tax=Pyrus ussuriensis x Pyrus communis TaxID=2448454 RepID=A0A5N5F5B2_9ROSA|nr:sulfate transporter 4.2 [Pyrus ussuriensis x Pyrus communis]